MTKMSSIICEPLVQIAWRAKTSVPDETLAKRQELAVNGAIMVEFVAIVELHDKPLPENERFWTRCTEHVQDHLHVRSSSPTILCRLDTTGAPTRHRHQPPAVPSLSTKTEAESAYRTIVNWQGLSFLSGHTKSAHRRRLTLSAWKGVAVL